MNIFIKVYQALCIIFTVSCAFLCYIGLALGSLKHATVYLILGLLFFFVGYIYWPEKFRQWHRQWQDNEKKDPGDGMGWKQNNSSRLEIFLVKLISLLLFCIGIYLGWKIGEIFLRPILDAGLSQL